MLRAALVLGYTWVWEDDLANPDRKWSPESLEALLVAAQRGDGDAYRRFLTAVVPFARAVARRRTWSPEAVEDVVQDALLTIHRMRHTYEPGRPVAPWVAAIVARRAIDVGRRRGRIDEREIADDRGYETFADPAANASETAENAETVALLVAELPAKQREALELVKLQEMSLKEASAASGQTVGALKVNVHRAMQRLKALVREGEK